MKTITITINISDNQQTTVKDDIQSKIVYHLEQKELCKQQLKDRLKKLFKIRETMLKQLNKEVGEKVWFVSKEGEYYPNFGYKGSVAVSMGFRDGIYKNTPYNDWDINIITPAKETITFGEISYTKLDLEKIKFQIAPTEKNNKLRSTQQKSEYYFTDLEQVHKFLEKDYITYFTHKNK